MKMSFLRQATIAAALLLAAVFMSSCEKSSVEQLNEIKKPAIVYSKHAKNEWYDFSSMVVKDANGNLVTLTNDAALRSLVDKYNVGDTIK